MSQYRLERYGDPDKWGAFQIVDVTIGSNKPVAVVNDPDMAQKIVDLLNAEPDIEKLVQEITDLSSQLEVALYMGASAE